MARPTSTTTELPALPPRPAIHALCALFVEVARADGEVARDEVRAIREFFQEHLHFEGRGLNEVRTGLKAAIAHEPREVEAVAKALPGGGLSLSPAAVLDALYAVALSDGRMMRAEQDAIRRAARGLGVSEATQAEVATRHFGDGAIHFQALGLKVGASNDEVKSAYRRLAAEHHPDRAATRGPRAVEEASRRFQTIHEAYEEIRRLRGL